jgi:hypothetical protein
MKNIFVIALLMLTFNASSQFNLYKEIDGLQFYTKWSHTKWYSKKSGDVLLVKVINTTNETATFSVGVEFFKEVRLEEESQTFDFCISAGKTLKPRVHGLVFQPSKGVKENYDSVELKDPEIKKIGNVDCPKSE